MIPSSLSKGLTTLATRYFKWASFIIQVTFRSTLPQWQSCISWAENILWASDLPSWFDLAFIAGKILSFPRKITAQEGNLYSQQAASRMYVCIINIATSPSDSWHRTEIYVCHIGIYIPEWTYLFFSSCLYVLVWVSPSRSFGVSVWAHTHALTLLLFFDKVRKEHLVKPSHQ